MRWRWWWWRLGCGSPLGPPIRWWWWRLGCMGERVHVRVQGLRRCSVWVVVGCWVTVAGCISWRRPASCCCQLTHHSSRSSGQGRAGLAKPLLSAPKALLSVLATYRRMSRTGRRRAVVRLCGTKLNAPTACVLAAPGLRFASDLLVSRGAAAAVALRRRRRQQWRFRRQQRPAVALAAKAAAQPLAASLQRLPARARHDHTLNPKPCLLCARKVQLAAVR